MPHLRPSNVWEDSRKAPDTSQKHPHLRTSVRTATLPRQATPGCPAHAQPPQQPRQPRLPGCFRLAPQHPTLVLVNGGIGKPSLP